MRSLLLYVAIAYGWTWITALPLLLGRRGITPLVVPPEWEAVAAFGPFVAALVVLARSGNAAERAEFRASLRRFDVGRGWLLFSLLSPFLFLAGAVAITAARGGIPPGGIAGHEQLASVRGLADLLIVSALLQALGEEPGWRGFMLPRLRERFGPLAASLVLFPVWFLWHLPMFLSRPEFGLAQFAGFGLGILSASLWLTLIRDATGSSGIAIAWHALLNVTRGLALAVSLQAFLAYGMIVTAGALLIAGWWMFRRAPAGVSAES